MDYNVHDVKWTDEKVKRFWDFYNNYSAFDNHWFSKAVGRSIIAFVKKYFVLKGKVLDYGIGKGHFSTYLLENPDIELHACDFSQGTVNNINKQFSKHPNFKGCTLVQGFPSTYKDNEFDIVFLIEAIEHFTDDYLFPTLTEANRILKPGGKFVVTTPNNENLSEQHVICPDCGGVFHRVQHVRSFSSQTLSHLIAQSGFETKFCDAVDFFEYGPKGSFYKVRNTVKKKLQQSYSPPHLLCIGVKK